MSEVTALVESLSKLASDNGAFSTIAVLIAVYLLRR